MKTGANNHNSSRICTGRASRDVRLSLALLHLHFGRLQEGPVLLLFLSLSFGLEVPPAVHASVARLLRRENTRWNPERHTHLWRIAELPNLEVLLPLALPLGSLLRLDLLFSLSLPAIKGVCGIQTLSENKTDLNNDSNSASLGLIFDEVCSVCFTVRACLLLPALFSWSPAQRKVSWSVYKPPAWTTDTQTQCYQLRAAGNMTHISKIKVVLHHESSPDETSWSSDCDVHLSVTDYRGNVGRGFILCCWLAVEIWAWLSTVYANERELQGRGLNLTHWLDNNIHQTDTDSTLQ